MIFNLSWRFSNHLLLLRLISNQEIFSRNLTLRNFSVAKQSFMELSQTYYESLKTCISLRSIPIGKKLHAQLIATGLDSSTFLQNHLMAMYFKFGLIADAFRVFRRIQFTNVFSWNTMINGLAECGMIREAQQLFEEMPERDSVSWNSMMSGYFRNGRPTDTIKVFVDMIRVCDSVPDPFSFACVMKACASLGYVELAFQLHGLVEKFDFGPDMSVESSIIDMYIKCGALHFAKKVFLSMSNPNLFCWNSMVYGYSILDGAGSALVLFNQMPERDTVSWNTMVSILSQHGLSAEALNMVVEMCNQGFRPNSMSYASIFSACANINDLSWGAHLHARILRMEPNLDVYVGSGLIDMYAKCGCLAYARHVFNNLTVHNVVSWTSLIGGVAQSGQEEEALALFKQMRKVPVASDQFTLATVLGVCYSLKDISLGGQLHGYAIKIGMDSSVPVGNALITMYSKCQNVHGAHHTFELMLVRDIISWTTMITAFSHNGNVEKAQEYFNKMPERNVITWNSMLVTYTKHGFWEEGLKLFILMLREGGTPDWVTFATSISACAYSAVLKLGNQIIAQAEKSGFGSDVSVTNSIVSMYSRCGRIVEARKVFDSIATKDLISWNAMMSGYAQSGLGEEVIDIFESMLTTGLTPDHISYVSILSGCSHSGLVPEGTHYFNMMTKVHGISPTCEHFTCMVDLLGRAGLLEQARDLIKEMPLKPNAAIWGALLGACRIHGDAKLAEIAMRNLIELDVEDSGSYVLLANIYSDFGKLQGVSDLRRFMRAKGIQKNPGCSWIEVDNRVHVFTVDDTSHPQIKDVYRVLEEIIKKIEDTGSYVNEIDFARPRGYHSEKLAMAFGLMSLPTWMPIHIMKNLRICRDCHLVIKLVSLVTSRELIVRDANRFHHFKDGCCSCQEYW
ncbi:hypothetical protein LguiB_017032 [Lonicera macranthoides]